ncbi:anaphase-promoting complex subunit CDC26-like [Schistocerca nitens]|uniref:anaphase-promoting complex subunit CDC26-like n=1 Tax=Schistocerca nitens TaxID=7011 RepID=UPI00211763D8|nr:anaphase-promoting complex subunit CDC26-like [Schistocerca nitens]
MRTSERDITEHGGYLQSKTMIRRAPTRIELKLEDLQEFEAARREMEVRRQEQGASSSSSVDATTPLGSSPPGGLWAPAAPNAKRTYRTTRVVGFLPQPHFT